MKNSSPPFIGFLQALGLASYISLVGTFIHNGEKLLGPLDNFSGPIFFLTLLSFSILVCGFIALGYPIRLFWIKKEPQKAMKIVAYTTAFLFVFLISVFVILISR